MPTEVTPSPVVGQGPPQELYEPVAILGVGTAVPPESYTQSDAIASLEMSETRERAVFTNSGIETRHLSAPRDLEGRLRPETQGELLRRHARVGVAMAKEAVESALAAASREWHEVGYICCVSSTGFLVPALSALLVAESPLRWDVARADIVGMGCNAGLNGLNAAASWASARPGSLAVVVCIEVCSAAYVPAPGIANAVVNSLFADGSSAAVLQVPDDKTSGLVPLIERFSSLLVPESLDSMRFDWNDDANKFQFGLDAEVPYVVGANAPSAVGALLDGLGVSHGDVDHWVVHSGGKKVIDAVRINLGLPPTALRHTISVLRDYGNLSSGSFLFSLDRLLAERSAASQETGVIMTMGPGATIETAFFRWKTLENSYA